MSNIRKQELLSQFHFSIPIQVRMSDCDPFAHVNNGAQCNYFDIGRSSYLEHVLKQKIEWNLLNLVIVHLEMDFLKPILIHDHVVCETSVYHIGNKSVKMLQQLKDSQSGEIKTVSKSVLAGFDREKLISITIPEKYKNAFLAFEKKENK